MRTRNAVPVGRLAVAGFALATSALLATPASAASVSPATPLVISDASCLSEVSGTYTCTITITGGKAPYTQSWVGLSHAYPIDGSRTGHCDAGFDFTVEVTVHDSKGRTAVADVDGFCIPPGGGGTS